MSELELACPVCLESFDTMFRIPLVLGCGHTYCKACLESLASKGLQCPHDRKPERRSIAALPRNFIIVEFLEAPEQITPGKDIIEKCKAHPTKRTKFYCKTDEIKICSRCLLMHKDHECFEILDYKDELQLKKPKVIVHKGEPGNPPVAPIRFFQEERQVPEYNYPPPIDLRRLRAMPYRPSYIEESKIIPREMQSEDVMNFLIPRAYRDKNLVLLYRFTEHGASNDVFHALCDKKGPTVTIVEANGHVFGGFTRIPWDTPNTHYLGKTKRDDQAFLFSLSNREGREPKKLRMIGDYVGLAVNHYKYLGPTFGYFSDMVIDLDHPHKSHSHIEHFKLPRNADPGSYLAGRHSNWNMVEIEVYLIQT